MVQAHAAERVPGLQQQGDVVRGGAAGQGPGAGASQLVLDSAVG